MSIVMVPPLPDPQQQIRALQQEIYRRNQQLNEMEDRLRASETRCRSLEAGVAELRMTLSPLYQGLQKIFGEMEVIGGSAATPEKSQVWESWKSKLGGKSAEAIDVLMVHGALNAEQLGLHLKCANRTIYNIIGLLNKAGIIRKDNGKISLKEL